MSKETLSQELNRLQLEITNNIAPIIEGVSKYLSRLQNGEFSADDTVTIFHAISQCKDTLSETADWLSAYKTVFNIDTASEMLIKLRELIEYEVSLVPCDDEE